MREGWQHSEGELTLDAAEVSRLVRDAIPSASVTAFRPSVGGLSNTNIEVELADAPHRVLLRLYQRDRAAAQREAAISALVLQQGVPAPRFLHIGDRNGRPYAVLEWIAGSRLETVAHGLAEEDLVSLGRSLGRLLASIYAIAFERAGFFDARLAVAEPIDLGLAGLRGFLHRCLVEGVRWRAPGVAAHGGAADLCRAPGQPARGLARPALSHPCRFQRLQHPRPPGRCGLGSRRGAGLGIRLQRHAGCRLRQFAASTPGTTPRIHRRSRRRLSRGRGLAAAGLASHRPPRRSLCLGGFPQPARRQPGLDRGCAPDDLRETIDSPISR